MIFFKNENEKKNIKLQKSKMYLSQILINIIFHETVLVLLQEQVIFVKIHLFLKKSIGPGHSSCVLCLMFFPNE